MPLPVGHTLAGYCLHETNGLAFFKKPWQTLLFFAVLANLPDIDFLPGFLLGNPNMFHHGIVHSLGTAVAVGALGAWYFSRENDRFWVYFAIIAGVFYSHLVLDFFNDDTRSPIGVMLFWPLSAEYFQSPWVLFLSVEKSSDSATFFRSLITLHNAQVMLRELLIMVPLAIVARLYRLVSEHRRPARRRMRPKSIRPMRALRTRPRPVTEPENA